MPDCTGSSCFGFVSSGLQAVAKYSTCLSRSLWNLLCFIEVSVLKRFCLLVLNFLSR